MTHEASQLQAAIVLSLGVYSEPFYDSLERSVEFTPSTTRISLILEPRQCVRFFLIDSLTRDQHACG